ncbi:MAG: GIY-YIG nuclease family protein [Candidatus Methylomirabilis sp.]|nr:GIY-YIG nuclease family protein [Deltaproteobacteria bacterium]
MRAYYVYIMASWSKVLYIGVTNDLERRVAEHKAKKTPGFTRAYNVTRLVYFEDTPDVVAAIEREKQLKGWLRARKLALIESANPAWKDLSEEWE